MSDKSMKKYVVRITHTEVADVAVLAHDAEEAQRVAEWVEKDRGECNWGNDKDEYEVREDPDVEPIDYTADDIPADWM